MGASRLYLWEKALIKVRAKQDVRHGRIKRVIFSDKNGDMRKLSPTYIDPNVLDSTLYSPFIGGEISKFVFHKARLLNGTRGWFWVYNDQKHRRLRRGILARQITTINQRVSFYITRLNLLAEQYNTQLREFDLRRGQYEHSGEIHMIQLYVNRAAELRARYAQQTEHYYVAITEMLTQIISILDTMESMVRLRRAKHYRRIQYYCEQACTFDLRLGPENMREAMLARMGNMELLDSFALARTEAQEMLLRYKNEFTIINSWQTGTS